MFGDIGLILWLVAFFYLVLRSENKFRRQHSSEHSALVNEIAELKTEITNLKSSLLDKEKTIVFGLLDGTLLGKKNKGVSPELIDIDVVIEELKKFYTDIEKGDTNE